MPVCVIAAQVSVGSQLVEENQSPVEGASLFTIQVIPVIQIESFYSRRRLVHWRPPLPLHSLNSSTYSTYSALRSYFCKIPLECRAPLEFETIFGFKWSL